MEKDVTLMLDSYRDLVNQSKQMPIALWNYIQTASNFLAFY